MLSCQMSVRSKTLMPNLQTYEITYFDKEGHWSGSEKFKALSNETAVSIAQAAASQQNPAPASFNLWNESGYWVSLVDWEII